MNPTPRTIRLTLEEWAAIAALARKMRVETGDNVSVNDAVRAAVKAACQAKGVPWPQ